MILYSLRCAKSHEFEAWFRDSAAFDAQVAKRAVACPECGSVKVKKAPMAPRLSFGRSSAREAEPTAPPEMPTVAVSAPQAPAVPPEPKGAAVMARQALEALRKQVEANCEYVGERFAEEARKIHYGETARRDIYGEANDQEAAALAEEGVEFHRVPWVRRTDS
jgi:hypothetical protein